MTQFDVTSMDAQLRAAWEAGRNAWCPASILKDAERTERDWQQTRSALASSPAPTGVEPAAIRRAAIEDVLDLLTAHELYRYRPKAFDGFVAYARTELAAASPQPVAPTGEIVELADEDAALSKIFALPLRLGKGTEHEAPIFDRNGELVGECVDDDCEERALAFIRAVNRSMTVKELYAAIRVLKLSLKHANEWRNQFDCCMCGSRMDDHDIGSGHSPVSMYDYNQDRLQAALTASEAEAADLRRKLEEARKALEKANG